MLDLRSHPETTYIVGVPLFKLGFYSSSQGRDKKQLITQKHFPTDSTKPSLSLVLASTEYGKWHITRAQRMSDGGISPLLARKIAFGT